MKRRKGDGKCLIKKIIYILYWNCNEILKLEVFRMKYLKLYDVERWWGT